MSHPKVTPLILPHITEFVPAVSHPKAYSIDFAPNYWICTPSVPSQGILHWFCPKLLNLYPQCPIPRYTPLTVPQITEFVPPVSHSKVYSIEVHPQIQNSTQVINNNNNSCLQKLMTNSWNEIGAWNWKFQSAFGFGTVCCPSLTGTGRFYPWMLYYIAPAAVR